MYQKKPGIQSYYVVIDHICLSERDKSASSAERTGADDGKPVVHLKSKLFVTLMTDSVKLPRKEIPGEIYPLVR